MQYQFISIDRLPVPAVPSGEWLNLVITHTCKM